MSVATLPQQQETESEQRKPDQAELLAQLAKAVKIENATPETLAAYVRLKASIWTAEDRAAGRKLGQERQAIRKKELRILWREWAIKAVIDNYDCGQRLTRAGMVSNLHSSTVIAGFRGRGGRNVQSSTISRWLTEQIEDDIWIEAISRIENRRHS